MHLLRIQLPCYEYTAGGHRLDRYEVHDLKESEAQRVYVCAAPYLIRMALDFYNNPVEHEDNPEPETEWVHSTAGALINKLKYWGYERPLEKLAERLSAVAANHLLLARAEAVISVRCRDRTLLRTDALRRPG